MALFKRKPNREDFEREALPHMQALYGAAMRLTRSQGDAEDLVQDALMRGYRFFDSFEPGTNCKAWLFRIMTNVFRNRYREREREHEILTEAESSTANLGQFAPATPESYDASILGRVVSKDVEAALESVPAEFRLAVILADLEDFSYKEIAEIMECPAGTVMSRLYRGRKMLQKTLLDYAVEQGIVSSAKARIIAESAEAPADPVKGSGGTIDISRYRANKNGRVS